MSITQDELKYFGSQIMPDDDTTTPAGSGIDTSCKIEFTQMLANSQLEVVSSAGGDTTQNITLVGRTANGIITTEGPHTLTGTTPKALGTTTFERILKVTLNTTCTGSVSGRSVGGSTWFIMEPGITKVRVPFYNASSDVAGGSTKDYYEKIFVKNTNGTLALTDATISEFADPSTFVTFGIAGALNDTGTAANRRTAPAGVTFSSTSKSVSGGNLLENSAQGVWLNLTLPAGASASKTSYTLRTQGNSI